MSGIIGHMTYAMLGHKAIAKRNLAVARLIQHYQDSYLAGSYLGADIMTLPGGVCPKCNEEFGYGGSAPEKCPDDGTAIVPYQLMFDGLSYTPNDIHQMFYGRTHLVFGWNANQKEYILKWSQLTDYFVAVVADTIEFYPENRRGGAYVLGWISHIIGDALIKSVQPGLNLYLLNGTYTPQNRPIQDLFSFHEVGRKELELNWSNLMFNLVETPVEPIQAHFMRLTQPKGQLGAQVPEAWAPEYQQLLHIVMTENRRYQRVRNNRLLRQMEICRTLQEWMCDNELSRITGGLSYQQMIKMAKDANFRAALSQIGETISVFFEEIAKRVPILGNDD